MPTENSPSRIAEAVGGYKEATRRHTPGLRGREASRSKTKGLTAIASALPSDERPKARYPDAMSVTARAVRIREPGDVSVLVLDDVQVREPGPGEVLVEVAAAGLNRADLVQRRGAYPAPVGYPADIPGLEFAGTVLRPGSDTSAFKPGDRVMGITGGGGMCTHLVAHERELLRVPSNLSLTEAAAVPEAFLTAWDAMFSQAGLSPGETLLVHAVASGVGLAALQLAHAAGAVVVGTSRTRSKLERCASFGLEHPVVPDDGRFAEQVSRATDERGVDVVLDLVGGAYLEQNLRALAVKGRIVVVGLMGGREAPLPLGLLLARRATVIGTVLRSRPLEEKAALTQAFARRALPLFASGKLRPVVDDVLPMTSVREAHERMERGDTFGKLVLAWT